MIVKLIQDLRKRMEAQVEKIQEMFNKELEDLKNKQTEMNNTMAGIPVKNRTGVRVKAGHGPVCFCFR